MQLLKLTTGHQRKHILVDIETSLLNACVCVCVNFSLKNKMAIVPQSPTHPV